MENSIYYFCVSLGSSFFCAASPVILRKAFSDLSIAAVQQLDIILDSTLEESIKDALIIKKLLLLLLKTLLFFFLLTLTILIGTIPVLILIILTPKTSIDVTSAYFYLSLSLGSLFIFFRKNKTDYSYWSRLLHTIVLEHYNIGRYLLARELKKTKQPSEKKTPFIVVTGLARAGTTALTKYLYASGQFYSINYSNMPFLLAPSFWKQLYRPQSATERERPHGDQVLFSENSIEALEEYFFKVVLHDSYIHKYHLSKHRITQDILKKYLSYQKLFKPKAKPDSIYLAKNNNLMLRYESIRSSHADFTTIVVFRSPLDHAMSLLSQHLLFSKKQHEDKFVLQYMDWLGHYEFGLNHKFFSFDHNESSPPNFPITSINYWLALWNAYYRYILQLPHSSKLLLVCQQDLAEHPEEVRNSLSSLLNINLEASIPTTLKKQKNRMQHDPATQEVNEGLLLEAQNLYKQLVAKKISI